MAKLTAEMRLSLDALRQDAERAATIMQQTMAKKFAGGGPAGLATSPAATISAMMNGVGAQRAPVNGGMAALGLGAGFFSPWIGARLLSQSGILNNLTGGGGGGGIGRALFGQGGFGAFGAAYLALQGATRMLKAEFDALRRSVKDAAQLFFDAAKLRVSPGQLMGTKTILKALGVEDSQELLQSLAYGRGRMGMKQMTQLIGIQGQSGSASYVNSFVKNDKAFWDEMARNSRDFHVLWTVFDYQLKKIAATFANEFLPALNDLLVIVNALGPAIAKLAGALGKHFLNVILGGGSSGDLVSFIQKKLFPQGMFGDQNMANNVSGLTWNRLHMSNFERMGFMIGNTLNGQDYQRQIAANTKIIADYVRNFVPVREDRSPTFSPFANMP